MIIYAAVREHAIRTTSVGMVIATARGTKQSQEVSVQLFPSLTKKPPDPLFFDILIPLIILCRVLSDKPLSLSTGFEATTTTTTTKKKEKKKKTKKKKKKNISH